MEDIRYPSNYDIDLAGYCNLRCIFCSEGKRVNKQPQKLMSLQEFIQITNSFLSYAKRISLASWSEPFLNKDVHKIISYIKKESKDISVVTSTNANQFTEEDAYSVVKSGLDHLAISISGITQNVYKKYHVGGDLNKVFRTLEYITEAKARYKSLLPFIEIVYLLFPFNYISLRQLKKFLSKKLGPDKFRQINYIRLNWGYFCGTDLTLEQLVEVYGENMKVYPYPLYLTQYCNRVHNNPAIRADGTVFPCCAITYNPRYAFGNLKSNSFDEIWNSKDYQRFRQSFDDGTNPLCENCTWYYPVHRIKIDRFLIHRIKGKLWLIRKHPLLKKIKRKWLRM